MRVCGIIIIIKSSKVLEQWAGVKKKGKFREIFLECWTSRFLPALWTWANHLDSLKVKRHSKQRFLIKELRAEGEVGSCITSYDFCYTSNFCYTSVIGTKCSRNVG